MPTSCTLGNQPQSLKENGMYFGIYDKQELMTSLTSIDGAFTVPIEALTSLNKSSLDGQFRTVDGSGVAALLEAFHQIHCVNLVRQYIYRHDWDYSKVASFSGGNKTVRHHVDHCIETIRMNIMCLSDVTPFLMEQDPRTPGQLRGNHNIVRKCRKYGAMVDWVKDNTVFMTAGK
ncbi:hypothetical protein P170DRAFT_425107 [Aspergillus steynii IBT 23096]|uniref:Uncharacterized protein n=1 Tax=Aspergillus steynii IBT 23096 TaxID=1392250 RepID=A0A2I2GD29_9EURO|nr:uncharacterized protein P170DRAFT_425107 [Aspergillus steynii IBT 23096]PLB50806.1 hypothetical protein P170DRAFT_425107 [Aspergillus steynii IBT 23096]